MMPVKRVLLMMGLGGLGISLLFTMRSNSDVAASLVPDHPESAAEPIPWLSAEAADLPPRAVVARKLTAVQSGRVWLSIGDTVTFGEDAVPRAQLGIDDFDIYCQDIRHGTSLLCPNGSLPAMSPISSVGLPSTAESAVDLIKDAPLHLAKQNLLLTEKPSVNMAGIGFVMARSGVVYRVHLEATKDHPDALQRRVLIGFSKMQQVEGGGLIHLPAVDGSLVSDENTPYLLSRALVAGGLMPGSGFVSYVAHKDHEIVERLEGELTVEGEHLIVKEAIRSKITVSNGSLILESGIDRGASIELSHGSGLVVGGDVHGKIQNTGYGFIYLAGNLIGEMTHHSYATAVIEGDLIGTLHLKSYTDVLIRGRLIGTLHASGSCWSTVYLESFISRQQLVDMKGDSSVTLHLASSDLLPGKHEKIGRWRAVIVADPVWNTLRR